ncbi:MAG: phosphoketolase family protein [Acidimicrobiia bacterium]|nr:phosphoketolase family protein [Acidimicrobiia bacterium]
MQSGTDSIATIPTGAVTSQSGDGHVEPATGEVLDPAMRASLHRWWRAANYLSVGQIYLLDNPLLREPLAVEHIKPRLLGHWGTTPGLNLLYGHLNRIIGERDQDVLFICGPGHGGPAMVACTWLEGTYTDIYPSIGRDGAGMAALFRQFSFPGGIPSHAAPETPGSIHEGGELGYALSHAYGAALDNPELVVACVIGDGEAETGPLATSWHANKFLDPVGDGAVLPILHLNGWKIANPTLLARIPESELRSLLEGYGYEPIIVAETDPEAVHEPLAAALDAAFDRIAAIWDDARNGAATIRTRPRWPMLVLRTPKGWTGPSVVDDHVVEGTWRSHQVPLSGVRDNPDHLAQLETWLRSYDPDDLFDDDGRPTPETLALAPTGTKRMGATPYANGGLLTVELDRPPVSDHAIAIDAPGAVDAEATRVLGEYLRELVVRNADARNFRVVGPDETESNRLGALYDVTGKQWQAEVEEHDEHLVAQGRVIEMLSEHTCQGLLEGYLLTGRHGLFSCYEAFIHLVDSMVNQHAKWMKVSSELDWRRSVPSLNYLITSHVWRQDHNGFSHQDPGFLDHLVNKTAAVVRVYLPPDANCLLSVMDHCLTSYDKINAVVAGKQMHPVWLDMSDAEAHCERGVGIWDWASNDDGDPDVVLACAGDVPTLEALAAVDLLRTHLPDLRVRVVNVVDLMRLQPDTEHPNGLSDRDFDTVFTRDKPVVFAFHGYPWLIHRLAYRRTNHANLHVRGYKERGTTTTPFDMVMMNDLDRFHLVMDVIDRVPSLGSRAALVRQHMGDRRAEARAWTRAHGEDQPEVRHWRWPGSGSEGGERDES